MVDRVPLEEVATSLYVGAVQPTLTAVLTGEPSATVGWLEAVLHSRTLPALLTL